MLPQNQDLSSSDPPPPLSSQHDCFNTINTTVLYTACSLIPCGHVAIRVHRKKKHGSAGVLTALVLPSNPQTSKYDAFRGQIA